jgi:hypothetical protein
MATPVTTVASGGLPVIDVTSIAPRRGLPVSEGVGIAVTKVAVNGLPVLFVPTGPNLVTNGDFALNPLNAAQNTLQNGWQWRLSPAAGTASVTWAAGAVTIRGDGVNSAQITTPATTAVGVSYLITVAVGLATCSVVAGITAYASSLLSVSPIGPGSDLSYLFTATTTTTWVTFAKGTAANVTISNVRVAKI